MKKGFTLVELLGVIVILGVLSVLIVPVVNDMMVESKEKIASAQKSSILKAAKNWGRANLFLLPDCDGKAKCDDTITITLGQVMNDGFLDNQTIKDVNKNKIYSEATEIVIGKSNNQNTYKISENPYAGEIETPEGGPTIVLNGSSTITLEASRTGIDNYIDPGVVVTDKDGRQIGYKIEVTKVKEKLENKNELILSTNKTASDSNYSLGFNSQNVASYKIVYTATANGKTAKNVRNVQIKDTTAPTISFVSNIEVDKSYAYMYKQSASQLKSNLVFIEPNKTTDEANATRAEALRQISKVVIMDNSCGKNDLNVSITSTVEEKVGNYTITYKVTDKYKNTYKKTRMIKIIDG